MTAPASHDAIVLGGGVNGLVAAAYLAKARKRVLLLEEEEQLGGRCVRIDLGEGFSVSAAGPALHALDPQLVSELKLSRHGLRFAGREMSLVGLRTGAKPLVLSRNVHDTAASILPHSRADAAAWPRFRKKLLELSRALRPLWWDAEAPPLEGHVREEIDRIKWMGVSAWLDTWFESESLKAALCFDATAGGLSIIEPASAIALLWHAAQEMSGLQGATMLPMGGLPALVSALAAAAQDAGAELRTGAPLESIVLDEDRVAGVRLQSGETCFAPAVLSVLPLARMARDLLPPGALGLSGVNTGHRGASLAEAHVLMVLANAPSLGSAAPASRFITTERFESYISAELAARDGEIGDELPIEFTVPTNVDPSIAPPGLHVLSATVRPLPRHPAQGWAAMSTVLGARVVAAIDKFVPNLSRDLTRMKVLTPDDTDAVTNLVRLTSNYDSRVRTPIQGLFLCGDDAEPNSAISGRAGRIAAQMGIRA